MPQRPGSVTRNQSAGWAEPKIGRLSLFVPLWLPLPPVLVFAIGLNTRSTWPFNARMTRMPAKPRIITAQAAADLFGPLGWVVLERQSRQLVCRICGGRTELWELRRLFHNRQKLLEFAGTPYAEISTAESFAVAWLICRAVILSNLARAKFRLHALSQRIFPLGRCPLCRGPPLKGVLVLPLPKAFDLQGQATRPFMAEHATKNAVIDPSAGPTCFAD